MIILGIESTAHTFGAGIVSGKASGKANILSNVKYAYTTEKGGIIPIDAGKHHEKIAEKTIEESILKAKIKPEEIDMISYSRGPGLGPCLHVGQRYAKQLSESLKKPLIPVNHCVSHLEIGRALTGANYPVLLYASGANTQIISYEGGKYRVFGETLDQGVGNFLDSFARHIGLGFPGGPRIYEMSLKSDNYIKLPYCVKGMDISVSGILTNLKNKYNKGIEVNSLCYSAQETVFAMLMEVSERAMAHCNKNELLLGGGVCCNKRLQEMAMKMCEERSAKCFIPPNEVLVDNGAMIAWQGYLERNSKEECNIRPYERTDDVKVEWV